MKATIVTTKNDIIYILVGVEAKCVAEINGTIPSEVMCINRGKVTVVKNPKKERMSLGPDGALNDEFSPKSINLVGVHFLPESIVSVETIEYKVIEPTYK